MRRIHCEYFYFLRRGGTATAVITDIIIITIDKNTIRRGMKSKGSLLHIKEKRGVIIEISIFLLLYSYYFDCIFFCISILFYHCEYHNIIL
jgi:hypothetical protein